MNTFKNEETMLVSFGNFLFNRYGVMFFSSDGNNTPLRKREVSDADILRWKGYIQELDEQMTRITSDDYELKHGDFVKVFLMPEGESEFPGIKGQITAINDKLTKKTYDVELQFDGGFRSRIHNVDSVLISPINS